MDLKRNEIGLLILRLTLGILMLFHGVAKLMGGAGYIAGMLSEMGLPGSLGYGVIVGEVIAPLLIIIGFRTRLAAFVYAINMVVAILMVHANDLFSINDHGGWAVELAGLYLFGAVALIFTGAGKLAVSTKNRWD